jgi:hypothetical protein
MKCQSLARNPSVSKPCSLRPKITDQWKERHISTVWHKIKVRSDAIMAIVESEPREIAMIVDNEPSLKIQNQTWNAARLKRTCIFQLMQ